MMNCGAGKYVRMTAVHLGQGLAHSQADGFNHQSCCCTLGLQQCCACPYHVGLAPEVDAAGARYGYELVQLLSRLAEQPLVFITMHSWASFNCCGPKQAECQLPHDR
jgi:hypothetical protein